MPGPFMPQLRNQYAQAEEFVVSMDRLDGGVHSAKDQLQTVIFALEAGLCNLGLSDGGNSAFDALVMLHRMHDALMAEQVDR